MLADDGLTASLVKYYWVLRGLCVRAGPCQPHSNPNSYTKNVYQKLKNASRDKLRQITTNYDDKKRFLNNGAVLG